MFSRRLQQVTLSSAVDQGRSPELLNKTPVYAGKGRINLMAAMEQEIEQLTAEEPKTRNKLSQVLSYRKGQGKTPASPNLQLLKTYSLQNRIVPGSGKNSPAGRFSSQFSETWTQPIQTQPAEQINGSKLSLKVFLQGDSSAREQRQAPNTTYFNNQKQRDSRPSNTIFSVDEEGRPGGKYQAPDLLTPRQRIQN